MEGCSTFVAELRKEQQYFFYRCHCYRRNGGQSKATNQVFIGSILEDVDIADNDMLASVHHSLQLDRDACGNLDSMIAPCCGDLRDLKSGHYHKIVEATDNAGKWLLNEYMVDEPTCSTPRKRSINLPNVNSIEELRTPAFDKLLKLLCDSKSGKQANGGVKHILGQFEGAKSVRGPRLPLTAVN